MSTTQDPRGLQLIDPVLTNLALNFVPSGFVYDDIVSYMDVATNAGQYPVWSLDDFYRDDVESAVADRAETPEIDVSYTLKPYLLTNRRLKVTISPEEELQAHNALRFRETKIKGLLTRMSLIRERRLAAQLRKTTNGGQLTLGGGVSNLWDVGSAATIEKDIKAARKAVRDLTGQLVDTIVIPWNVGYAMALDPSIRDIVKFINTGSPTDFIELGDRVLPKVIHGLNVVIAGAMVNTAREGATASLSDIWGKNVVLIKRTATNNWGDPATCYALRGTVATNAASVVVNQESTVYSVVDKWVTPDPPVEHTRVWDKRQEKITAPDVGYEIAGVIS